MSKESVAAFNSKRARENHYKLPEHKVATKASDLVMTQGRGGYFVPRQVLVEMEIPIDEAAEHLRTILTEDWDSRDMKGRPTNMQFYSYWYTAGDGIVISWAPKIIGRLA